MPDSLPTCSVQYPRCGSCGGETTWDDVILCEPCGLSYGDGEDGTEAEFTDDTEEPCGKPCDNHWHSPEKIRTGWRYECHPCRLPDGHTSDCWTNCTPHKIEETHEYE